MIERALTKCLSVFFIVISIYPIATVPSIVPMFSIMKRDYDRPSAIPKCQATPQFITVPGTVRPPIGFDLNPEEIEKFKIWHKGTIPFYIDIPSFSDKSLRDRIRWYLNEVNSLTFLNFIELPRPPVNYQEERWVYFLNRGSYLGCHDISINNFTTRGVQRVVLGYDCLSRGGGLAEIVLALAGVPPQHNAPNRDEYIRVFEENIIPEKKYLFRKLDNHDWLFHDIGYDHESAGHFNEHKYSANGAATLRWKGHCSEETPLGQDEGFSKNDILKINMLYQYIVQESKTDLPTCRKLFARVVNQTKQPRNQFKLTPGPRRKPNKYLGIASVEKDVAEDSRLKGGSKNNESYDKKSDNKESDNNESDNNESDDKKIDKKESDNNEIDKNESDDKKSDIKESDNENDDKKNNNKESDNNEIDNNENDDYETDDNKIKYNQNDEKDSQNSVDQSNPENDTSEKTNGRNLSPRKTTRKPLNSYKDPLTYLSDYQTGDERLQRSVWRNQNYKTFGKLANFN